MPDGPKKTSVLDLVQELEALPEAQRSRRLDEVVERLGLNEDQRRRIEECLGCESNVEAGQFLERPPAPLWDGRGSDAPSDALEVGPGPAGDEPAPHVPGYEVQRRIGVGGMGTVWRAVQLGTRRPVALKLMNGAFAASDRVRARFDREVQITARLEHPNVARVFDSGVHRGAYYYAMELVEPALPLDRYAEQQGLSRRRVLELMLRVCRAVAHAHENGVIHRDLKPANILVGADGQPKVLDFGLAKALAEGSIELTVSGEGDLAGTPAYMSPEQAAGGSRLDTRSDVYSLGVILYRLLIGKSPHELSGSRLELLRRISEQDVTVHRAAALGKELEAVLLKALARDKGRRYATAAELAADLDRLLKGEPITARPPTLAYLTRKRLRRHWAPVSLTTAAAALLVGVGVWSYARESRQRQLAEANLRESRVAQGESLIAQGDALAQLGQWREARQRYEEAHPLLALGGSTFLSDLALWNANRVSPTPLLDLQLVARAADPAAVVPPVTDVAFLPGGREFVAAAEDGTVRVLDTLTGRTVRTFSGNAGPVTRLAVSPDGRLVACAARDPSIKWGFGYEDPDGPVTLWNVQNGSKAGEIRGFSGQPLSVAFSPDGRQLLVGSSRLPDNVVLFDVGTNRRVGTLVGHDDGVTAVAFAPDGRAAFTGGGSRTGQIGKMLDTTVRRWDVAGRQQVWAVPGDSRGRVVDDMAISEDGGQIATAHTDDVVLVRDAETGMDVKTFPSKGGARGVAFSPNGRYVAVAQTKGPVRVWSVRHGGEGGGPQEVRPFAGHAGAATTVRFSADGRSVVSGGEDGAVRLWPVFTGSRAPGARTGEFGCVAVSPDSRLAMATERGPVARYVVWDVATGKRVASEEARGELATNAAFGADGRSVLVANESRGVHLWDLSRPGRPRRLDLGGGRSAYSVAVSADGRFAAAAVEEGYKEIREVVVLDLASGGVRHSLQLPPATGPVHVVFSPDASVLITTQEEGGVVSIWETATGRLRHTQKFGWALRTAVSPDGTMLACAGERLWIVETSTGRLVRTLADNSRRLLATSFTPDGRYVLAGGDEGHALIWDARSGRPLTNWSVLPADGRTADFAWSGDGRCLLVAAADGWLLKRLQWWDLSEPSAHRQFSVELAVARRALDSDPNDARALRTFGRWYMNRGRWAEAATLLEQGRAGGAEVHATELARAHWLAQNWAEARRELAAARAAATAAAPTSEDSPHLESLGRAFDHDRAARRDSPADDGEVEWLLTRMNEATSKEQWRQLLADVREVDPLRAAQCHTDIDYMMLSMNDPTYQRHRLAAAEEALKRVAELPASRAGSPRGLALKRWAHNLATDMCFSLGRLDESNAHYDAAVGVLQQEAAAAPEGAEDESWIDYFRRWQNFGNAHWIWHRQPGGSEAREQSGVAPPGTRYLRGEFVLAAAPAEAVRGASLWITADERFVAHLNGEKIGETDDYENSWLCVQRIDVARHLKPGRNVLAVKAVTGEIGAGAGDPEKNRAGVLARLLVEADDGPAVAVVTDAQWRTSDSPATGWEQLDFDDSSWTAAVELAPADGGPWKRVRDGWLLMNAHFMADE